MIRCNLFSDYDQVYILALKDNEYKVLNKDNFNVTINENNRVVLSSKEQSIEISLFEFYKSYIFYNKKELNNFSFNHTSLLSFMKRSFELVSFHASFCEICNERGINDETVEYIFDQNGFNRYYSGWYPVIIKHHTILHDYSSFDISLADKYIRSKILYGDTIADFYKTNDYLNHIPSFVIQIDLICKELNT